MLNKRGQLTRIKQQAEFWQIRKYQKSIRQHAKEIGLSSVGIQSHFAQVTRRNGWAGIAQSVQRVARGWTVRESNSRGGEIFLTSLDRPWGPPSFLYNGYRVFLGGVKRLTTHHYSAPMLKKKNSFISTLPLSFYGLF